MKFLFFCVMLEGPSPSTRWSMEGRGVRKAVCCVLEFTFWYCPTHRFTSVCTSTNVPHCPKPKCAKPGERSSWSENHRPISRMDARATAGRMEFYHRTGLVSNGDCPPYASTPVFGMRIELRKKGILPEMREMHYLV